MEKATPHQIARIFDLSFKARTTDPAVASERNGLSAYATSPAAWQEMEENTGAQMGIYDAGINHVLDHVRGAKSGQYFMSQETARKIMGILEEPSLGNFCCVTLGPEVDGHEEVIVKDDGSISMLEVMGSYISGSFSEAACRGIFGY